MTRGKSGSGKTPPMFSALGRSFVARTVLGNGQARGEDSDWHGGRALMWSWLGRNEVFVCIAAAHECNVKKMSVEADNRFTGWHADMNSSRNHSQNERKMGSLRERRGEWVGGEGTGDGSEIWCFDFVNIGELFAYTFYFFFAGEVPMLYFLPVGKVKWRIEMVHFT